MAFFLKSMIRFSSVFSIAFGLWIFGGFEIGEVFFRFFVLKGLFLIDHRASYIEFFLIKVILHVVFLFVVLNGHFIVSTFVERFTNFLLVKIFVFLVNFFLVLYYFFEGLFFNVVFDSSIPKVLDKVIDAAEDGIVGHKVKNDSDG